MEAEAANPGLVDIAVLHAIVTQHDASFFPGDPVNPVVETARDVRDVLVADIAGETVSGRPDPIVAAIAQRNDITYSDAQFAVEVAEVDRLNDQEGG